ADVPVHRVRRRVDRVQPPGLRPPRPPRIRQPQPPPLVPIIGEVRTREEIDIRRLERITRRHLEPRVRPLDPPADLHAEAPQLLCDREIAGVERLVVGEATRPYIHLQVTIRQFLVFHQDTLILTRLEAATVPDLD